MDWRTDLSDFDGMYRMCIEVLSLKAGPSGNAAGTGGLMLSKGTQLDAMARNGSISPALFHGQKTDATYPNQSLQKNTIMLCSSGLHDKIS